MKPKDLWYRKIGFFNNPFSIKPGTYHNMLFGVDEKIKNILKLINKGESCFISGEYGSGKTTVLKKIITENKGKIIYHNFNASAKSINVKRLLIGRSGFLKRMMKLKARNVILLLDEVQDMTLKDARTIKDYYENGYFKSVAFVATQLDKDVPEEVAYMVNDNIFEFKGLDEKSAVKLVRQRVGSIKMISDDVIKKVNKKSNNPRDLLKNMEDVFRYCVDNGSKKVTEDIVKEVLG